MDLHAVRDHDMVPLWTRLACLGDFIIEQRNEPGANMSDIPSNIFSADAPGAATIRRLKEWVDTGVLVQGLPLPSERVLSARMEVSRKTLRRALVALTRDGVIKNLGPRTRVVAGPSASSSVGKGTMEHSIAVLAPSVTQDAVAGKHQPGWLHSFLPGAHEEISDQGYNLFSIHPDRVTDADLRRVIEGRPMGVVCPEMLGAMESNRQKWLHALRQADIPIVAYGNSPDVQAYDRVASDHDAGGYELTRWLLGQGRRRIAMFFSQDPDVYWVRGRRSGYERAMREAGLEPRGTIHFATYPLPYSPTHDLFEKAFRHRVGYLVEHIGGVGGREPLDALLLESDGDVYAIAAACRLLGRNPGSDVMLAGYDDYALDCPERQFEPCGPQVTMDKRNSEMGREMVRLLIDRCEGRLPEGAHVRSVRPELVVLDGLGTPCGLTLHPTEAPT